MDQAQNSVLALCVLLAEAATSLFVATNMRQKFYREKHMVLLRQNVLAATKHSSRQNYVTRVCRDKHTFFSDKRREDKRHEKSMLAATKLWSWRQNYGRRDKTFFVFRVFGVFRRDKQVFVTTKLLSRQK